MLRGGVQGVPWGQGSGGGGWSGVGATREIGSDAFDHGFSLQQPRLVSSRILGATLPTVVTCVCVCVCV